MKQRLIDALEALYPGAVYLQGTLNPDEAYPETFVTIWTALTEDNAHYDDALHSVDWDFTVILYSSDPRRILSEPPKITGALRKAGFLPQGLGRDLPSDRPSHTGWAMEYKITQIMASDASTPREYPEK